MHGSRVFPIGDLSEVHARSIPWHKFEWIIGTVHRYELGNAALSGYTKNQKYAGEVPWINLNPKKKRDVNEFNLDDWLKSLR